MTVNVVVTEVQFRKDVLSLLRHLVFSYVSMQLLIL